MMLGNMVVADQGREPRGRAFLMSRATDRKPLVAEVIGMDEAHDQGPRARLSGLFTDRVDSVMGVDIDDPAGQFLFENVHQGYRNNRLRKRLRRIKSAAASVVLGFAGAWLLWQVPGLAPQAQREADQRMMQMAFARMTTLEAQLGQSQGQISQLLATVETQQKQLQHTESARQALAQKADEAATALARLQAAATADHERLELVATAQNGQAVYVREQADLLKGVRAEVAKLDGSLAQTRLVVSDQFEQIRSDALKRNREELQRFSKMLEAELAALKTSDLNEMRTRVERLAEHVWQEVGRLDGRIVRVGGTKETAK